MQHESARAEHAPSSGDRELDPKVALEILRAVGGIHFGSVEVVVHDGRVVQIERKQKIRIAAEGAGGRR